MHARIAVLALLASVVLAGCAEQAAPAAAPEAPEVILVTEANDIETLANDSFMMAAHQHDYWGGKDRLLVLDATRSAGTTWFGGDRGFHIGPEDGVVVPHGTARVEITLTWTDPAISVYSNPTLWVKTAADHETQLIGPVASGETLVVETDDADADLPHQGVSSWVFEWRISPGEPLPAGVIRNGANELSIKAEAVRGREIPIYPPHPDLWDGKDAIHLLDDARGRGLWTGAIERDSDAWSCITGCPIIHTPVNGTVVPFDAAMVEVVLDVAAESGFDLGLKFRGALSRNWTDLVPVSVDGGQKVYQIPVEPGLGDSPYASQSVWGFTIFSEKPERDGWFSGSYTITARALRDDAA